MSLTAASARQRPACVLPPVSTLLDIDHLLSVFIIGRSGVGKHLYTATHISDYLARGKAVTVLDAGRNYRKFAEVAGGAYVTLRKRGFIAHDAFGEAPLTVIDFEQVQSEWTAALPVIDRKRSVAAAGLVVVDETAAVLKAFPALVNTIAGLVEAGAAYCITGQSEEDVAPFRAMKVPSRTIQVSAS